MGIKWIKSAVCYADGHQWLMDDDGNCIVPPRVLKYDDFQLNTIKQGDYIEDTELDTEQKYNNAVEVFGLFGFEWGEDANTGYFNVNSVCKKLSAHEDGLFKSDFVACDKKRKLTYPQIMAIGELKLLELERSRSRGGMLPNHFLPKAGEYAVSDKELEKSAPKIAPDLATDLANKKEIKMQKNKPVVAQVMIDLTERMEIGIKTYGEALRANNGRDALQDAYEEALDLACYLKQAMIERDNANNTN